MAENITISDDCVEKEVTITVSALDAYVVANFLHDPFSLQKSLEDAPESVVEGVLLALITFYSELIEGLIDVGAVKVVSA